MRESTYAVNRARSKARQARKEAADTQSVADALDRAADAALGLFEQAIRFDEQEAMKEDGWTQPST